MLRVQRETVAAPRPHQPDLLRLLHAENPYQGFAADAYPFDPSGWNGTAPLFGELIDRVRPTLTVEVGSWKGQSAITMGRHLQRLGNGSRLLCVDTWLGSYDFWTRHDPLLYEGLAIENGYPTVYRQFLANIVHAGLQKIVVPFPSTSINAARYMIIRRAMADLIYIDAGHEQQDVEADIRWFWRVLRPGGVLFGDDYNQRIFPGLVQAVRDFSTELGIEYEVVDDQYWVLQKPRTSSSVIHPDGACSP